MQCPVLNVTLSKTSQGDSDYMQITSEDQVTINIVLIVGQIKIKDTRSIETNN